MNTQEEKFLSLIVITIIDIENLDEREREHGCYLIQRTTHRSLTFRISFIISAGSIELVVFIDHVNRSERGLVSPGMSPITLSPMAMLSLVVGPAMLAVMLALFKSVGRR